MAFITLTNSGYIDYTRNCLKSLERIGSTTPLHTYCIGKDGYKTLTDAGYPCTLIDEEQFSGFQTFRKGCWSNIVHMKFKIIYENLLKYDTVCFTDGDIVFEHADFYKYLTDNLGDKDMLVQSEALEDHVTNIACSGFMFIKSNPATLAFFDPKKTIMNANKAGWGDQVYVNANRHQLKHNLLPLKLYPNGRYYYKNSETIKPYMIHFNWLVGHTKKTKMKKHGKWYLD